MSKDFTQSLVTTIASGALVVGLAACQSSGSTRIASVGDPGASSVASSSSSGGGDTSSGGSSGGSGSSSGGSSSSSSGGSSSGGQTGTGLVGKLVVLSGNVVLGTSNTTGNLAQRVNALVPGTQPVTGIVTKILDKTGQGLVDLGNGRTLLVDGLRSKVGEVVTLAVGGTNLTNGATPLIGVNLLTKTPTAGSLATVGVLAGSDVALVDINKTGGPVGGAVSSVQNVVQGDTNAGALVNIVGTVKGVVSPGTGTGTNVLTPVTGTLGSLGGLLGGKRQ